MGILITKRVCEPIFFRSFSDAACYIGDTQQTEYAPICSGHQNVSSAELVRAKNVADLSTASVNEI